METSLSPMYVSESGYPFQIIPKYSQGSMRATTQSDIYEGYYIPRGMSYICMLSTRNSESFTRGNRLPKRLVRSSCTP